MIGVTRSIAVGLVRRGTPLPAASQVSEPQPALRIRGSGTATRTPAYRAMHARRHRCGSAARIRATRTPTACARCRCFRMGFSAIPLDRIEPGVRALAQCVRMQKTDT
ncbi:hypothetical protein [Burkholderia sp. S-53]|uniref:hypothetical protein n=1 Tax=Burkholderia sp. S-53 TaxID=2906514 RepID=UPI0021CEBACF|nr:hypothetical protein [Burkholderia sp. S-53]UXU92427.1 hypothetical protein LXM88_36070 [Burkholderia sp. S-53]